MPGTFNKVIIVGAGPVGLLLAYMLAQQNVEVVVLESDKELNKQPRGIAYGPPAVEVLKRAGLLDDIHERGTSLKQLSWRKVNGDAIAILDRQNEEDEIVVLPVPDLTELLMEKMADCPTVSVHFDHHVSDVGTLDQKAWVDLEITGKKVERMFADFVVGCDGGKSDVRKSLLGHSFPGYTWQEQIIATDIIYDLEKYGWSDAQWIIDPEYWGIIAKTSPQPHRWRVGYAEKSGLSNEEMRDRLPQKLETILPGHPKPEDYELVRFSPFTMNQRCAERMRVGRVLLAGDAAHLCNPMGGLGLTGGVADIGSLIDCFYGMLNGRADIDILDKYDEMRRKIYDTHTNPSSTGNLKRMMRDADAVIANDPFVTNLAEHNEDFLRALHDEEMKMACDMTQYYTK